MNDNKEYLPIGTVVLLENAKKKIMIIGYKPKVMQDIDNSEFNNKIWDYSGCMYPEGVLSSDQILLFNHSQIVSVFFKGYQNEEYEEFKNKLNMN